MSSQAAATALGTSEAPSQDRAVLTQDAALSPLADLKTLFAKDTAVSPEAIRRLYATELIFKDPAKKIVGLERYLDHTMALYQNLNYCEFEYHSEYYGEPCTAMLQWTMKFSHKRIASGREQRVSGVTCIRWRPSDGKITLHEDWFDLGALIYEHLPVFGRMVRAVKKRLAAH